MRHHLKKGVRGEILIQTIVFASVAILILASLINWANLNLKAARYAENREAALQIAEAGIDYYRWHLAHSSQDYQDGTGAPGPYTHIFTDKDGNAIGKFILTIIPPPIGSTLVVIASEGRLDADSTVKRTIRTQLGIPSWAKYAWALNSFVNFGTAAEVFGEIYSNEGIRFDGLAHNLVSSAKTDFDDPDHGGGNEFGVHTHKSPADPLPPAVMPIRPDVFMAGRTLSVPALDFSGLTSDLSQLKTKAQAGGLYFSSSGAQGYNVILKTNDTLDLYKVTGLVVAPGSCASDSPGKNTWSIASQTLVGNYPFPANGVLFIEDHAWVEGQIDTARVTVVSGRFPENPLTNTTITINNNIRYTNYNGSDALGFIAQGNINVGLNSANDIRIDGALIAKNGRIGRYNYSSACGASYIRNSLTTYGSLATNQRPAFYYGTSGYLARIYNYDASLLYAPPPSFPLTSNQYSTLSWEELEQ